MRKIKIAFVIAVLVLIFIVSQKPSKSGAGFEVRPPQITAISNLLSAKSYDAALSAIDSEIAKQKQNPTLSNALLAWLYETKAVIHANRYHFHFAIAAMKQSFALQQSVQKTKHIDDWQAYIDNNQTERNKRTRYISGNNLGLAKTLTNKITVAYIYINDNANHEWTAQRRLLNQTLFDNVLAFYQREGERYQQGKLDIDVRYFVMRSPKGIGKNMLRKYGTFTFLQQHFLQQSNYRDFDEFIADLQGKEQREVAIVFHTNHQARSYAFRCKKNDGSCGFEHAMLTEDISLKKQAWLIPQVQAHEILHLFGADDLYQIRQAKDFAVTDIMNYHSRELRYASIDPITAWAIGWRERPQTPFNVEEN